jgi:LysR family carnitine catabolism transcriptional activator
VRIDLGIPHLRAVVAVADARGFTAAAADLHVAQSSLSRTVAEAERRLRVRLFERTPRGVEMTTEGREVVALARHLLGEYDAGLRHVTGYLEGTRGTLTLAALPAVAATLLPSLLAAYRSTRPDVTVQVLDMLSEENLQRVRDGTVDLAVTSAPPPDRELVVQPMVDDCFFAAVSPEHRLAGPERLTWSDLDGESFVAFSLVSTSVRGAVDRVLAEAGIRVGRVLEARTVGAVAGLTAAGLGVSVLPGLVLPMIEFAGLRHVLLEPIVRRRICLVRHRRRPATPAVLAFLDTVRSAAAGAGPLPRGTEWRFEPGQPR